MPLKNPKAIQITSKLLKSWPLPMPGTGGDKEARGLALIIAGTDGMPGAALLPSLAALRAGAGKIQIAVPKVIAAEVAVSALEAFVFALPEIKKGVPAISAIKMLKKPLQDENAILIGPGMKTHAGILKLTKEVVRTMKNGVLIIDAESLKTFKNFPKLAFKLRGKVIVTPHAGEMADILQVTKASIEANPMAKALAFARSSNTITVLKGARTFIASPEGELYCNDAGNIGLGTSGSGDALSGIITGLCARGAEPLQAAVWGVSLHARAGDRLMRKMGPLGYLARELLAEVPIVMNSMSRKPKA